MYENKEIINGKEFRLVIIRGRGKLIAKDGEAINPYKRNQKATIHFNSDGYPCFGGGIPVHLYVAHAWVDGYFDGAEVNHKDFDRTNYNADNLEWISHIDNIAYSQKYNYEIICKSKQGINNGRANFNESEIIKIRQLYDNGMNVADILRIDHPELKTSKQYKSLHSTYMNICKRKTWKHI